MQLYKLIAGLISSRPRLLSLVHE